ncbi:hypothetical protein CBR_g7980 [Chara braunii]|uniref:Uncharacterized protein n=1 Tax=Chara braunii TaxID=69332 RepID=A0A388KKV1_CHABU|nr:hypothetical protein CBR_g7980 [Chara braunii]|eukprot:GBG70680.1 hypothetical protein CBR_g7980 [Chara braunii]
MPFQVLFSERDVNSTLGEASGWEDNALAVPARPRSALAGMHPAEQLWRIRTSLRGGHKMTMQKTVSHSLEVKTKRRKTQGKKKSITGKEEDIIEVNRRLKKSGTAKKSSRKGETARNAGERITKSAGEASAKIGKRRSGSTSNGKKGRRRSVQGDHEEGGVHYDPGKKMFRTQRGSQDYRLGAELSSVVTKVNNDASSNRKAEEEEGGGGGYGRGTIPGYRGADGFLGPEREPRTGYYQSTEAGRDGQARDTLHRRTKKNSFKGLKKQDFVYETPEIMKVDGNADRHDATEMADAPSEEVSRTRGARSTLISPVSAGKSRESVHHSRGMQNDRLDDLYLMSMSRARDATGEPVVLLDRGQETVEQQSKDQNTVINDAERMLLLKEIARRLATRLSSLVFSNDGSPEGAAKQNPNSPERSPWMPRTKYSMHGDIRSNKEDKAVQAPDVDATTISRRISDAIVLQQMAGYGDHMASDADLLGRDDDVCRRSDGAVRDRTVGSGTQDHEDMREAASGSCNLELVPASHSTILRSIDVEDKEREGEHGGGSSVGMSDRQSRYSGDNLSAGRARVTSTIIAKYPGAGQLNRPGPMCETPLDVIDIRMGGGLALSREGSLRKRTRVEMVADTAAVEEWDRLSLKTRIGSTSVKEDDSSNVLPINHDPGLDRGFVKELTNPCTVGGGVVYDDRLKKASEATRLQNRWVSQKLEGILRTQQLGGKTHSLGANAEQASMHGSPELIMRGVLRGDYLLLGRGDSLSIINTYVKQVIMGRKLGERAEADREKTGATGEDIHDKGEFSQKEEERGKNEKDVGNGSQGGDEGTQRKQETRGQQSLTATDGFLALAPLTEGVKQVISSKLEAEQTLRLPIAHPSPCEANTNKGMTLLQLPIMPPSEAMVDSNSVEGVEMVKGSAVVLRDITVAGESGDLDITHSTEEGRDSDHARGAEPADSGRERYGGLLSKDPEGYRVAEEREGNISKRSVVRKRLSRKTGEPNEGRELQLRREVADQESMAGDRESDAVARAAERMRRRAKKRLRFRHGHHSEKRKEHTESIQPVQQAWASPTALHTSLLRIMDLQREGESVRQRIEQIHREQERKLKEVAKSLSREIKEESIQQLKNVTSVFVQELMSHRLSAAGGVIYATADGSIPVDRKALIKGINEVGPSTSAAAQLWQEGIAAGHCQQIEHPTDDETGDVQAMAQASLRIDNRGEEGNSEIETEVYSTDLEESLAEEIAEHSGSETASSLTRWLTQPRAHQQKDLDGPSNRSASTGVLMPRSTLGMQGEGMLLNIRQLDLQSERKSSLQLRQRDMKPSKTIQQHSTVQQFYSENMKQFAPKPSGSSSRVYPDDTIRERQKSEGPVGLART